MRIRIYFFVLLLFCFSCNIKKTTEKKVSDNKYSFRKIEYKKLYESFDSTFTMNGHRVKLSCDTEYFNDFSIPDTINDTIINLYKDRFLKFTLISNKIDTQIVVTKEILKNIYNNNSTYKSSVLAFPCIEKIDLINNSILIRTMFLYPSSLIGTNFLEEIVFGITYRGEVFFSNVILPPVEPDSLNTNRQ